MSKALAESYPALRSYFPHLQTISLPQAAFLLDLRREAVYGGAAGGGKSDAILAAALQFVDVAGYAALILRRSMPMLRGPSGLLARSQQWLATTDAGWSERESTWTFPSGAKLRFGHVEHEQNKFDYDGQEYQFVGFDELTHFTETQYDWIGFSRTRRTVDIPVPIRTRGSATPSGPGYGWVKKRFVQKRGPDVAFVPARVSDNPGFAAGEYEQSLSRMPDTQRRRLLEGDWDVNEGAAFIEFDRAAHCIDGFDIPDAWQRFESLDFGINNPTCWLAYAVDYDGNIVIYDEYYSPGLVSKHAAEILKRRHVSGAVAPPPVPPSPHEPGSGWAPWGQWGEQTPASSWVACYADPSVRNRTGTLTRLGDPASVLTEFADNGVGLTPGNNDPVAGYARVSELLTREPGRVPPPYATRLAGTLLTPRLFIVERKCPNLVEQLQAAPLLPSDAARRHAGEIVDPDWESAHGHAVASLRYGLMSRPSATPAPEPVPETPEEERAAFFREAERREMEQEMPSWAEAYVNL